MIIQRTVIDLFPYHFTHIDAQCIGINGYVTFQFQTAIFYDPDICYGKQTKPLFPVQ